LGASADFWADLRKNNKFHAGFRYNADGQRVRKTTGGTSMDYLYDLAGHKVADVDPTGVFMRGELYAGGRHFAVYAPEPGPTGATFFTHSDWLGTERVRTNMTGANCESIASLPFGDGQTITGTCGDVSPMHFTGKERDTESGLDNFGARYDSSSMGRFMTPDWSDSPEPIPYASTANPQSLNLYTYAQNNPLRNRDADGHWCFLGAGSTCDGYWEKLGNWVKYGENVLTKDLNAALAKHPEKIQKMKDYIKSQNTNISAEDLDVMPNKQVMDIANRVRLEQAEGAEGTSGAFLLPFIDPTGKVHTDLPNRVPDNWTREEMEEGAESLRQSIKTRKEELIRLGEESGHRERIRQEERLLRQLEKKLSGS
jgi:RHS repeat-associated protein